MKETITTTITRVFEPGDIVVRLHNNCGNRDGFYISYIRMVSDWVRVGAISGVSSSTYSDDYMNRLLDDNSAAYKYWRWYCYNRLMKILRTPQRTVADWFKKIDLQWSITDGPRVPDEDDVDRAFDEAAKVLYNQSVDTQLTVGGMHIVKTTDGHDVFMYVGSYE